MHKFVRYLKRILFIMMAVASACISMLLGTATIVRAETHVSGVLPMGTTTWVTNMGPYILDDEVTVRKGSSLVIMPGTSVAGAHLAMYTPGIFVDGGVLSVHGKGRSRVSFQQLGYIGGVNHAVLDISNADIDSVTRQNVGITVTDSTAIIATTTIINAATAIEARRSSVSIWGSRLYYNESGLIVRPPAAPILMSAGGPPNTGGIGNALEEITPEAYPVTITGSSFLMSNGYAIANYGDMPVHAVGNWWGGNSPASGIGNAPYGPIELSPWLSTEPPLDLGPADCCSSILFLPGLEGTRLYRPDATLIGASTNQLWEPNRNLDVEKLYMNATGSPSDSSIYAGGPIDAGFGVSDVYGTFMKFLDGLVAHDSISEWQSFGYDWRKSPADVVAGRERRATTTESLEDVVISLARRSRTGKVTIIAHSNGGLVAKALVKALGDTGQSGLVDSVISVAVPYLGTPAAIGALLHGDGQSIFKGLILSQSTAQTLAHNMPSAYSLLPSGRFFSEVSSPVIVTASSTPIASLTEESAFIAALGGNANLDANARALHDSLDAYVWPSDIARWAIVGWNMLTTKGIDYGTKLSCAYGSKFISACATHIVHHATTTFMGDGTVVAPSATYNAGTVLSLDLSAESSRAGSKYDHANILGASTTQAIISTIISSGSGIQTVDTLSVLNMAATFPGVRVGAPEYKNDQSFFVVSTHSPVELSVYDSLGRHTGPVPKPSAFSMNDAFTGAYEEGIPGSHYESYDNGDGADTYIYLPYSVNQTYSALVTGVGFGEFTFDVDRYRGDEKVGSIAFAPAPVTPLSTASTTILATNLEGSTSSAPILRLDINGDGKTDMTVATSTTGNTLDSAVYLRALRSALQVAATSTGKGKGISTENMLKRIDRISELMRTEKFKGITHHERGRARRIGHFDVSKVSTSSRRALLNEFESEISRWEHAMK